MFFIPSHKQTKMLMVSGEKNDCSFDDHCLLTPDLKNLSLYIVLDDVTLNKIYDLNFFNS